MTFRRILVIPPTPPRAGGAMEALVAGLRERYPGARIDRLLPDGGIVPAGREGRGDGETDGRRSGAIAGPGVWSASTRARRGGYDLAVVSDPSLRAALVPFLAGIPFRIGPGSRAGRLLFSMAIPFDDAVGPWGRVVRILTVLDPHAAMPPVVRPESVVRGSGGPSAETGAPRTAPGGPSARPEK